MFRMLLHTHLLRSCVSVAFNSCLLLPPSGGPGNFIYMQLTDSDSPSKTGQDNDEDEKVARLVSLPITTPDTNLCMSFWYHMFGEHAGSLHIKHKREGDEEQILWVISGHQGSRWREGRVLLPRSNLSYQVMQALIKRDQMCLFIWNFWDYQTDFPASDYINTDNKPKAGKNKRKSKLLHQSFDIFWLRSKCSIFLPEFKHTHLCQKDESFQSDSKWNPETFPCDRLSAHLWEVSCLLQKPMLRSDGFHECKEG